MVEMVMCGGGVMMDMSHAGEGRSNGGQEEMKKVRVPVRIGARGRGG